MKNRILFIKRIIEQEVKFSLSDIQIARLLLFYELTIEKNKVMNLTAITEFEEFIKKHYLDSLSLNKIINNLGEKKFNLIDIGTGAGFPGIPLKILYPKLNITLFDSLKKRLSFLDEIIFKLDLKDIRTIHGRAEEFGRKLEYREKYDIVVSRAVAELNTLSELTLPFCKLGGSFVAYKGTKGLEEIKNAERCISELGGKVKNVIDYSIYLPEENNRLLIEIYKYKQTNSKYPRGGGKPFKNPL